MSYPKHTIQVEIEQNASIEEVIAGLCNSALLIRSKLCGQYHGATLIVGPGDHAHRLLAKYNAAREARRIRPIIMETAA